MNYPRWETANSARRQFCTECGSPLAVCPSCGFRERAGREVLRRMRCRLERLHGSGGTKIHSSRDVHPKLSPTQPGECARYRVLDLPRETLR